MITIAYKKKERKRTSNNLFEEISKESGVGGPTLLQDDGHLLDLWMHQLVVDIIQAVGPLIPKVKLVWGQWELTTWHWHFWTLLQALVYLLVPVHHCHLDWAQHTAYFIFTPSTIKENICHHIINIKTKKFKLDNNRLFAWIYFIHLSSGEVINVLFAPSAYVTPRRGTWRNAAIAKQCVWQAISLSNLPLLKCGAVAWTLGEGCYKTEPNCGH